MATSEPPNITPEQVSHSSPMTAAATLNGSDSHSPTNDPLATPAAVRPQNQLPLHGLQDLLAACLVYLPWKELIGNCLRVCRDWSRMMHESRTRNIIFGNHEFYCHGGVRIPKHIRPGITHLTVYLTRFNINLGEPIKEMTMTPSATHSQPVTHLQLFTRLTKLRILNLQGSEEECQNLFGFLTPIPAKSVAPTASITNMPSSTTFYSSLTSFEIGGEISFCPHHIFHHPRFRHLKQLAIGVGLLDMPMVESIRTLTELEDFSILSQANLFNLRPSAVRKVQSTLFQMLHEFPQLYSFSHITLATVNELLTKLPSYHLPNQITHLSIRTPNRGKTTSAHLGVLTSLRQLQVLDLALGQIELDTEFDRFVKWLCSLTTLESVSLKFIHEYFSSELNPFIRSNSSELILNHLQLRYRNLNPTNEFKFSRAALSSSSSLPLVLPSSIIIPPHHPNEWTMTDGPECLLNDWLQMTGGLTYLHFHRIEFNLEFGYALIESPIRLLRTFILGENVIGASEWIPLANYRDYGSPPIQVLSEPDLLPDVDTNRLRDLFTFIGRQTELESLSIDFWWNTNVMTSQITDALTTCTKLSTIYLNISEVSEWTRFNMVLAHSLSKLSVSNGGSLQTIYINFSTFFYYQRQKLLKDITILSVNDTNRMTIAKSYEFFPDSPYDTPRFVPSEPRHQTTTINHLAL